MAIEADRNVSIETDIFSSLTAAGQLGVLKVEPPMLDPGTPEGLAEMEAFLNR